MTGRFNIPLRIAAVTATTAIVSAVAALPASAAAGDVEVVNTETVQVYTDASGAVQTQRVYEQLALTGTGSVDLKNPIETDGLRNLDGFGDFDVEDGQQLTSVTVDGEEHIRSVSDYTGNLPLDVKVEYYLDGDRVEPGDVVGESGELEVKYVVKNVTGKDQEVTFSDGNGGTVTKTVNVPIPMVGSVTTTLPAEFTEVDSKQANMAGDGKGGTKLSFTMTLFPPIGSDTAEFGYTARIADGVVPRSSITALPVNPLESPTFATAATSYKGGADTGIQLTDGATQIDSNLLKLRDGAGELLAGLIKLRDGAQALESGLAGKAAPGANQLAAGATELNDGLFRIDDGAGQLANGTGQLRDGASKLNGGASLVDEGANLLADGAGRLSAGTGDAFSGSRQLTQGLSLISGGLAKLADAQTGLPSAEAGIQRLRNGVDLILSKLGTVDDPATLIGGLAKLESGLGQLKAGAGNLHGGLNVLTGNAPSVSPGIAGAKAGVDQVQSGLAGAVRDGGSIDQLLGGLDQVANLPDCGATCKYVITQQIVPQVQGSKTQLSAGNEGLIQVSAGLGAALGALNGQLIPGAATIQTKLGDAETGAAQLKDGGMQLKGGIQEVRDGLGRLDQGITAAVRGVLQLANGAESAYLGSSSLTDGLGLIDAGAGELSSGAGRLADGTGQLTDGSDQLAGGAQLLDEGANKLADGTGRAADGSGRLADGANELADGLGAAADGSGKLAGGLEKAANGAPKLVDGAQRLSDEGTKKLVEAGESTAQNYGEMYATIEAGAERAQDEKMAYGAPEGAVGLAAYSYEIKGEDGEGGRNLARGLGGLGLLAAGAGAFALRRRVI